MTRATVPAIFFGDTDAGPAISPRNAFGVSAAYACVRALADAAASLPLHTYRRGAEGGRERVDEHPTARRLRRPAPAVPTSLLVWQMVATMNLWGECFLALYGRESVEQLALLPPDRVQVKLTGGVPFYTVTAEDGRTTTVSTHDVVHVRAATLDGVRGVSPVRAAREALGYAQALAEHGSATMRHGGAPRGVLQIPPGPEGDEAATRLATAWEARHGGPTAAGKVAVLSADVSFTPISMSLADAEFIQQRQLSDVEVARIFRVPPWVIGAKTGDSLTYSTVAEQARAFVDFSLRPWLVAIEDALAGCERLFPEGSGLYPQFSLDGLLRGDAKARAEVYSAALDPSTGWLRRDEVRELEDLPAEAEQEAAVA